MRAVELENVWKTYDRVRWVLKDASLAVEPGEVVVLMGRSGSGKSTLLNLVVGLESPTRGIVRTDGQDMSAMEEDARTRLRLHRLGMVFQQYHLIPELTVFENVHLPMRLAKKPDPGRARELLAFFGIEGRADDFPSTLSGGESQRAAIARALANKPVVVLADEPTANLDDENAQTALHALRRVADELDTGVLIASHDPMARGVGDRIVRIQDGTLRHEPRDPTPRPSPDAAQPPTPDRRTPTPG